MGQMILLHESNDTPNESNYTNRSHYTPIVGAFDPFKGVILDIDDYTFKGAI